MSFSHFLAANVICVCQFLNPRQLLTGLCWNNIGIRFTLSLYCCQCCSHLVISRLYSIFILCIEAEPINGPQVSKNIWSNCQFSKQQYQYENHQTSRHFFYPADIGSENMFIVCLKWREKNIRRTQVIVMKQKSCHWNSYVYALHAHISFLHSFLYIYVCI